MAWQDGGEAIDLFSKDFLWERGCAIARGDKHLLMTPKGGEFTIKVGGTLPCLFKNDLNLILNDLPGTDKTGCAGHPVETPTAARVCRTDVASMQLKGLS